MWMLVFPKAGVEARRFYLAFTGDTAVPETCTKANHVATLDFNQGRGNPLVVHVFDLGPA